MKIGIYDPYLDDGGGGEKYMLKMAECLSRDNEVVLFWNNQQDVDLNIERFGLDLSNVKVEANIFSKNVSTLKRALYLRKFDSIIVLSDGSIPLLLSKKLFVHIQRPIGVQLDLKDKFKLSRINKIFVNSYYTKRFVDSDFGAESVVIYPPVDLKPKKIKKENIILHVGRFRVIDHTVGIKDYKKQHIMVDAFKNMVKKGFAGWKLILAVSVKEEDKMYFDELVKKCAGTPIRFVVNNSNDEIWDYYSRAKIYWHASGFGEDLDKNPEAAEHFGISTVEAMGAGAVPVVFNAGGQKEIVEDHLSGFLWTSLAELEEKTKMVAAEEKIWEKMSHEAKKRATVFSGDRFCEEVKRLIEND